MAEPSPSASSSSAPNHRGKRERSTRYPGVNLAESLKQPGLDAMILATPTQVHASISGGASAGEKRRAFVAFVERRTVAAPRLSAPAQRGAYYFSVASGSQVYETLDGFRKHLFATPCGQSVWLLLPNAHLMLVDI